jgi:hypothetical protein
VSVCIPRRLSLKMETTSSSETLVLSRTTPRHYIPEQSIHQCYRRESTKSSVTKVSLNLIQAVSCGDIRALTKQSNGFHKPTIEFEYRVIVYNQLHNFKLNTAK